MGLTPAYWGPHVWAAIHLICLGAPESFTSGDAASYRVFFENLPNVLPCDVCKNHLIENLRQVPIDTALSSGRDALFAWSVKLHNAVNVMLGKPIVSLEDAQAHWLSIARGAPLLQPNGRNPVAAEGKAVSSQVGCIRIVVLITIALIVGTILGMYLQSSS